jgi:hypothetical protein
MAEGTENSLQDSKPSMANTLQSINYNISILLLYHCQQRNHMKCPDEVRFDYIIIKIKMCDADK